MSTGPQPPAATAPPPAKPPLIDAATDQALAGVGDILQGDQRMAGAEGPLQSHPQGLQAAVQNAPVLARATGAGQAAVDLITQGVATVGGAALSGIQGAAVAVPFLQALLRPIVERAVRMFAAGLRDLVIVPLEAELTAIAANHPDVNLDRARAAVGSFYEAVPEVPRPAPGPFVGPATGSPRQGVTVPADGQERQVTLTGTSPAPAPPPVPPAPAA